MSNPLTADDPVVSKDKASTIAQLRFTAKVPSERTLDAVAKAADAADGIDRLDVGGRRRLQGDGRPEQGARAARACWSRS